MATQANAAAEAGLRGDMVRLFRALRLRHAVWLGVIAMALGIAFGAVTFVREQGRWEMFDGRDVDLDLYLDTHSIAKIDDSVTFWTKIPIGNRFNRWWLQSEVRHKTRIDCKDGTFATLDGGIYVRGQKKYPFERPSSGKLPATGNMKNLRDRVCQSNPSPH